MVRGRLAQQMSVSIIYSNLNDVGGRLSFTLMQLTLNSRQTCQHRFE